MGRRVVGSDAYVQLNKLGMNAEERTRITHTRGATQSFTCWQLEQRVKACKTGKNERWNKINTREMATIEGWV